MSAVSLSKGWWLFGKALLFCKPWRAGHVAEWMYYLNVTARNLKRHPIVDQIYLLKDEYIKYLYQHGHCFEVRLHKQTKGCWSCDGTGTYWTGEECYKCDGTGTFSVTYLYAFRFNVDGKRYAWHQLKRLVDYPVTLINAGADAEKYNEPDLKNEQTLAMEDAWYGSCIVWWWLLLHRVGTSLLLFPATRQKIRAVLSLDTFKMRDWKTLVPWWHASTRVSEPDGYIPVDEREFDMASADDVPF